jgi:capreomycidine synthase
MREYYFDTEIDIGSSGVQNFSLAELRQLLGFELAELDPIVFTDSSSLGEHQLRRTVASRWSDGNPDRVMMTHGSSEAIYLTMTSLLRPGDEVIVLDPCYQSLSSIAKSLGAELKSWILRFEDKFVPDVNEFRRLATPATRMVIVNFPHNPTGASLTVEQQKELIEIIADAKAYLVWDAAFAELTYDSAPLPDPTLSYDRAISIGTLSKAYGLPGLRVGWCLAPENVLTDYIRLRDYTTLFLSPLIEFLARKALESADILLNIRLQQARTNLELLTSWIEQDADRIEWSRPTGGVCAFPHLHNVNDVEAFCRRIAGSHGILLVPGRCFDRPEHVRLGFGGSTSEFEKGLSGLQAML